MVAIAYRRWLFTRSSNCKAFTGKVLVFWIGGRLREVVAYEKCSHMEVRLYKAWAALGKFLGEFVYLAVEICHRWTLLSATPSFQVRKNFENRQKHQIRRSAWVGQADFGKLELNNRNHSGNCQRLVMNVIPLKHDQFKINAVEFSDLREEASTRLSFAISSFFRKISTGKDFTRL